jgi:chromosome partitioning protein
VFDTTISDGVAIGESHLAKCSIYEYNNKSRQAKEYESFIEEFLNELKK